jgi:hypothetical protein
MKFFLTIVMLAIFANIGLTTILDNALAQMQNPNQQQIPQPQRQTDHPTHNNHLHLMIGEKSFQDKLRQ